MLQGLAAFAQGQHLPIGVAGSLGIPHGARAAELLAEPDFHLLSGRAYDLVQAEAPQQ